jgi:hypothetical protein
LITAKFKARLCQVRAKFQIRLAANLENLAAKFKLGSDFSI